MSIPISLPSPPLKLTLLDCPPLRLTIYYLPSSGFNSVTPAETRLKPFALNLLQTIPRGESLRLPLQANRSALLSITAREPFMVFRLFKHGVQFYFKHISFPAAQVSIADDVGM